MKSINEIRDMIMGDGVVGDLLLAILDHVELLESKLTPSQKLSLKIEELATDKVDYTKPHPFDLGSKSGMKHTSYRVCKCGLSEGNVLHPR